MAQRFEYEMRGWRLATGLHGYRGWSRRFVAAALATPLLFGGTAGAQDCTTLLSLFQQGFSTVEIAEMTGLASGDVEFCRRQLSRPIFVGPAGPPPVNAAGPPPRNPAGSPPVGAAGPPPVGAAGPPPVGRDVKRLP